MDILQYTAVELGEKIRKKEVTVKEAVLACLEQMKKTEEAVHAYVTIDEKGALEKAEKIQ